MERSHVDLIGSGDPNNVCYSYFVFLFFFIYTCSKSILHLLLFPIKPTTIPANTKHDDAKCVIVIAFGKIM